MGKLKVRLSFKEFSLELEGSRDEVPQIGQNLGRQIAGLIAAPAANIAPGQIPFSSVNADNDSSPVSVGKKSSGKARKSSKGEKQAVSWTYDGQAYGTPRQSWTAMDKAIWLLYVGQKALAIKEMGVFPNYKHIQRLLCFNEAHQ